MNKNNLIIAYSGNGKGKTTAALGLCFRALSYGKKVLFFQFIKSAGKEDGFASGEQKIARRFKSLTVKSAGSGFVGILGDTKLHQVHKQTAKKALKDLEREIKSGNWQIIVADEILVALNLKLLNRNDIIKLIKQVKTCQAELHLVLTGRGLVKGLLPHLDLVTEMKEIKHPFSKGVLAVKGVDF